MPKVPAAKPTVLGEKDAVCCHSIENDRLIEGQNTLSYASARELRMDFPPVLFEPPETPEQLCIEKEEMSELLRCVAELTPRHRRVLSQAYGLEGQAPWTFKAIAEYQWVSTSRAQQLVAQALRRLRRKLENSKIVDVRNWEEEARRARRR